MEREVHTLAKSEFTSEAEILGSQNNISRRLIGFGNMAFDGAPRNPGTTFCQYRRHAAKHFFRSAVGDDSADMRIGFRLTKHNDTIHQIKPYVDMMLHHHQGFMGSVKHTTYRIMHFLDAFRIKVGGRLVKQQQPGMHGEYTSQSQTLTLPARKPACGTIEFHIAKSNNVE